MTSKKFSKSVYLALVSLASIPLSAAQTIGQNQGIEASLLEFTNTILTYEVESASGVLLYFVAPMAGFYFVQKNMLSYGFELFEERIDRNTYGRTDDEVPNGIKGLSIVTGFITVQMLGSFSAGILLATGLISILLAAIMQLGLLDEFGGGGGGNANNTTTNTTNNTTQNTQNQGGGGGGGGGAGVNWNQVGQTAANFANNVQQANQNKKKQGIKNALSVFSNGTDVIDLIDHEPSDFRNHVQDIRNARNNGTADDVNSLEKVLDRLEHIEDECEDLVDDMGNDVGDAASKASGGGGSWDWGSDSDIRATVDGWDVATKLVNLLKELQRIKKDQKNTVGSLKDQLDHSWDDIQIYIKIHRFSQALPRGPKKVANSNNLLNELVSEAMDRNQVGGRGSGQAKNDFKAALEKIDQFEEAHKNLISDLEEELEHHLKLDETEVKKLKEISSDDDKIREAAKRTKNGIEQIEDNYASSGSVDMSTGSPDPSSVKSEMDAVNQLGRQIDNEIQDIYSVVQSEGKFENESYKKLKDLK